MGNVIDDFIYTKRVFIYSICMSIQHTVFVTVMGEMFILKQGRGKTFKATEYFSVDFFFVLYIMYKNTIKAQMLNFTFENLI